MEILNIRTFFKFLIHWNLVKFPDISVNFEDDKMINHILEIPQQVVLGVKCFNYDFTKSDLRNNHRTKKI